MPLYEFHCDDCGSDFEDLVPYGTQALPCPACGGGRVKRRVSVCGFSVGGRMTTTASSPSCTGCSATSCSTCGTATRR